MSQMAPEAPPRRRRDNAFTRKIGPLPMWAWLAIVATAIVIWGVYSARKNAQAQAQQSTTNASQVPDFILQDYQQAGPPGPPGPAGPPGGPLPQPEPVTIQPNPQDPSTVYRPVATPPAGTPAKPVATPIAGAGSGHQTPGPVRARGTVRTTAKAPHPARKPAPRHTAPRHPARG